MFVSILREAGYEEAVLGISLSYNTTLDKAVDASKKLARKDGGHNKFLESIVVWLDMTAPRYFWQQFDTYRVGVTKQSESTMHTLTKRPLTNKDFVLDVPEVILQYLNELIANQRFEELKNVLPEGFLQRRVVCLNYKAIRNIMMQRYTHKLKEWSILIAYLQKHLRYQDFLPIL